MAVVNGYMQNENEKKLDILNLPSLEEQAKQIHSNRWIWLHSRRLRG